MTDPALPADLLRRSDGEMRRVGFEIEFAGMTFENCLDVMAEVIGGEVKEISPIEAELQHPEFGPIQLELDWQFLKQQARDEHLQTDLVKLIGDIAGTVVPLEVVFPPIAFDRIDGTDPIISALRDAGASGTDKSLLYAFGVHINPEIPDLDAGTIARYLKAYCLLQAWLVREHSIDSSRRLSPYVDLYKQRYIDLVLEYDAPSIETLINDYLKHNPTRNRALDMLPMLSEIDSDAVQEVAQDDRIKARPTFHYRMPNCDLGNPDWSLVTEWRRWCYVERLANSDDLASMAREYQTRRRADVFATDARWIDYVDAWAQTQRADTDRDD